MFTQITDTRRIVELYLARLLWYRSEDGTASALVPPVKMSAEEERRFLREWGTRPLLGTYGIMTEE